MLATSAMMFSTASAEHASAEKYRQWFRDGKFYVEYQLVFMPGFKKKGSLIVYSPVANATENGSRVKRVLRQIKQKNVSILTGLDSASDDPQKLSYFDFAFGRPMSEHSQTTDMLVKESYYYNHPLLMYHDGKYYRFLPVYKDDGILIKEIRAYLLPEDQLNSPDLDLDQE